MMRKFAVLFATLVTFLPMAIPSRAQTNIIKDTFQENTSAQSYPNLEIDGVKASPTNLPGSSWQLASGDGTYEAFITTATASSGDTAALKNSAACFHNVASAGLSLTSSGSYVKPAALTISADLSFGGVSPTGYCLLGFYSALPGKSTYNPLANFTGLQLQKDGSLQLIEAGTSGANGITYMGKYDPAKPVTLSYTIDANKGTISNITLSGSTSTYAISSSAFTSAATAFAGIGGQTDGTSWSFFNNFVVSTPDMSTPALSAPPAVATTPAPTVPPAPTPAAPAKAP